MVYRISLINHMNTFENSKRLSYRRLEEWDFSLFSDLYSDERVMQYTYLDLCSDQGKIMEQFREILDEWRYLHFVATIRESNIPIGFIFYEIILEHPHGGIAEIGFILKPEFWGNGYATEMAKAMIKSCFEQTSIHKVIGCCNVNNTHSEKILRKIGMKKEGRARRVRYKHYEWWDEVQYGLLREEYI